MTIGQSGTDGSRFRARDPVSYQTGACASREALSSYRWNKSMIQYPLKSIAEMSEAKWERAFPDEEICIELLMMSRWPDEKHCPRSVPTWFFPLRCTNTAGGASVAYRTLAIPSTVSPAQSFRMADFLCVIGSSRFTAN